MNNADPPPAPLFEDDDAEFLALLGERVRTLRARRGMTRKALTRDSGVSERFLAQLESGEGNISIVKLRHVARAMGLPVEHVVQTGPERPVELTLLIQSLGRLTPTQLGEARALLSNLLANSGRRQRIALIGLRGAGKTTLGRLAASALNVPLIELGSAIEQEAGITLSEIFSLYGQAAYRRYEARALQRAVEANERFILVPGGSIVSEPATFDILLNSCFTIWIRASPEEHMARVLAQGDHRPMSDSSEAMRDLERILAGRESMYAKAEATLDTTGSSIDASLSALLALLPE